jgi:hypothetical protein
MASRRVASEYLRVFTRNVTGICGVT